MRILIELLSKQPPSCEPNGCVPVGFNGVPPLTQEAVLEKSCTGRVQRNLNLGGNTDMEIRPKLVIYQLRAFCFGNFNNQQFYNYNIMYGLCHIGCAWKRGKK